MKINYVQNAEYYSSRQTHCSVYFCVATVTYILKDTSSFDVGIGRIWPLNLPASSATDGLDGESFWKRKTYNLTQKFTAAIHHPQKWTTSQSQQNYTSETVNCKFVKITRSPYQIWYVVTPGSVKQNVSVNECYVGMTCTKTEFCL